MAEAAKMKDGKLIETLRAGDTVVVTQGHHAGEHATVIDPVAIADGLPHQRKVMVTMHTGNYDNYILPRQLTLAEAPTILGGTQ